MEVHNELGGGFLERVHQCAMVVELRRRGIGVAQQADIEVEYKGEPVGRYVADLLADANVIYEVKAADAISPSHQAQLLNYLKATGVKVGLLNFSRSRLQWRRMVY